MNDKHDQTSGKTATAEPLEDNAAEENRFLTGERPAAGTAVRGTTAGLGTFDRVSNIVGTTGFGIAPGVGTAGEKGTAMDTIPGITGVDSSFAEGMPGTAPHPTRFTDADDRYWRENHATRHYANPASNYEEYQPAYQYGTDAAHRYRGREWEEVQRDLERGWDKAREGSSLAWENVKDAARAAWDRVERALPGDADHDGR
jgi:hypothetical protein